MKIYLNGELREFAQEMSMSDLLADIGFGAKPVVVELNQEAIFARDYATTLIKDGARVEIVMLAAGG